MGKCRFRTLLLSATYSKSTRDILVEQFHDENSELIEVSANFLRPEAGIFVHHEANENAHRQRVEQLLMTLLARRFCIAPSAQMGNVVCPSERTATGESAYSTVKLTQTIARN